MERMSAFAVKRPTSVAEAAALLASEPGARLLAGGTGLLPNLRRGIERPAMLVDLGAVHDFAEHRASPTKGLSLGAGVTLSRACGRCRASQHGYRAVAEAARAVAGPSHRSVATIGGNLCLDTRCVFYNQSEWWRATNEYCLKRGGEVCHVAPQGRHCHAAFSGDVAPALLVLGAEVELVASRGTRRIAALRSVSRRRRRASDDRRRRVARARPRSDAACRSRIRISQGLCSRRDRFSAGGRGVRAFGSRWRACGAPRGGDRHQFAADSCLPVPTRCWEDPSARTRSRRSPSWCKSR